MKKVVVLFLCIILTLTAFSSTVSAAVAGNSTALCVGTNFGDFSTVNDANTAASYYSGMVTTTKTITVPKTSNIGGSHSNGQGYLTSGIVFLSGHGANDKMLFNYYQLGGEYAVGINKGNTDSLINGYYYFGLGSRPTQDVALYVFAGCETAQGTNSLAEWVTLNNQGAKSSIGWTTTVTALSHTTWLSHFNYSLSLQYSVSTARSYADSFTYLFNDVKNNACFGAYNYSPLNFINNNGSVPGNQGNSFLRDKTVFEIEEVEIDNIDEFADNYMKANYGNVSKDFIVDKNGSDRIILDYVFAHKGIRTNCAITFVYDIGEKKLSVFDNMNGLEPIKMATEIERLGLSNERIQERKRDDYQKYYGAIEGKIDKAEQFLYYDAVKKELFSVFGYVSTDEAGCKYADAFVTPYEQ